MTEYQVRRAAAEEALQREVDTGYQTHAMTLDEKVGAYGLGLLVALSVVFQTLPI